MKHIFGILVALFPLSACTSVTASDPAVLVCEEIIKSTLVAPKTFEVVQITIDSDKVLIEYDASNQMNVPIRNFEICQFQLDAEDGLLHLSSEREKKIIDDGGAKLQAEIAEIKTLTDPQARYDRSMKAQEEGKQMLIDGLELMSDFIKKEMIAKSLSIYPIDPVNTDIKTQTVR